MFAMVSLALFLAGNAAAAKTEVDAPPSPLAQVLEQALVDFELRYAELGLLGSAPLAGMERVTVASDVDGDATPAKPASR